MDNPTNARAVKGQRLAAAAVDYIILIFTGFIASFLLVPFIGAEAILEAFFSAMEGGADNEGFIQLTVFTTLFELILGLVYYGLIPAKRKGQTIGKMFFHVKAVDEEGENPSLVVHLKRAVMLYSLYLGTPALLLILVDYNAYLATSTLLGFITSGIVLVSLIALSTRSDARGLHDIIAKTYVVDEYFSPNEDSERPTEKEDPLAFNYDAWEDKDDPWS
ncbi:MAG: RDD family protein [Bacillota bacterium]